jgi:outer membrane protein OmpA-like peptidoglycan-associated protein
MTHRTNGLSARHLSGALLTLSLAAWSAVPAQAQELPRVRVTREDATIRAMRYNSHDSWLLMRADAGALFDVIAVDGDQSRFVSSNFYLVVLPRDPWGTRWVGWISGRHIEPAPPRERAEPAAATPVSTTPAAARLPTVPAPDSPAALVGAAAAAAISAAAEELAATPPAPLADVVLRFAFDRSELSEAAKDTLMTTLTAVGPAAGSLSFAVGGHADGAGPTGYNHRLGLARAEAVRQFIVDHLKIPGDRIHVSSHGETQPVASNATPAGRAENRRVVITVAAPATAEAQ